MAFALRAVLVALALPCGLAARQQIKLLTGRPAAVQHLMTQISSMIEARHEDPTAAVASAAVPEETASEAFNAAIQDLLDEITQNIKPVIEHSHGATQEAIDTHIANLRTADGKINDAETGDKAKADAADKTWLDCVGEEKELAGDIEEAREEEAAARSAATSACQIEHDNKLHSANVDPEWMKFTCDISLSAEHDCDTQWTEFVEDFESNYMGFVDDVDAAFDAWDLLRIACVNAEAEQAQKQSATNLAVERYRHHHNLCVLDNNARVSEMCNFEAGYEAKCARKSEYEALLVRINTPGDEHSKADRIERWTLFSLTECMVSKVKESLVITVEQLDQCQEEYNVSWLEPDLKTEVFNALTTEESFNCRWDASPPVEERIRFYSGKQWKLNGPAPEPPLPSDDYVMEEFMPVMPFCENLRESIEVPGTTPTPTTQPIAGDPTAVPEAGTKIRQQDVYCSKNKEHVLQTFPSLPSCEAFCSTSSECVGCSANCWTHGQCEFNAIPECGAIRSSVSCSGDCVSLKVGTFTHQQDVYCSKNKEHVLQEFQSLPSCEAFCSTSSACVGCSADCWTHGQCDFNAIPECGTIAPSSACRGDCLSLKVVQ